MNSACPSRTHISLNESPLLFCLSEALSRHGTKHLTHGNTKIIPSGIIDACEKLVLKEVDRKGFVLTSGARRTDALVRPTPEALR